MNARRLHELDPALCELGRRRNVYSPIAHLDYRRIFGDQFVGLCVLFSFRFIGDRDLWEAIRRELATCSELAGHPAPLSPKESVGRRLLS